MKYMNLKRKLAILSLIVLASNTASAAVDVSGVVTAVQTDVSAGITAIGAMLLTLAGLALTYKWLKAMFF